MLLLSGDINLNPGPTVPCCICSKSLRQKIIFCNKCQSWFHKKCVNISEAEYKILRSLPIESKNYCCHHCLNKTEQAYNWDELPFLDNLLEDDSNPVNNFVDITKSNIDWEIFKKRGLHFIHVNINSSF